MLRKFSFITFIAVLSFGLFSPLPGRAGVETFDILDLDGNGVLTLSEFRELSKNKLLLESAFNRLDTDGNEMLSRSELGLDGRRLLKQADMNQDGQLSVEELEAFFSHVDTDPVFKQMDEDGDGDLQRHEYFLQKKETKAGFWVPLIRF